MGQVFRCNEVQDRAVAGIIYATQGPKSATQYPDGVAYPLAQDQIVMLEYHAVNTGSDRADLKVLLNLTYATTPKEFNPGTLFFYNYTILIPPRSQASVTMRCNVPSDMTVLAGSSHMHARGVAQRSRLLDAAGADLMPLYDTGEWDEPEIKNYEPGLEVRAGQVVEFTCDYDNPGDTAIVEGPATTDEMCMAPFMYYTPTAADPIDFATRLCWTAGNGPVYGGTRTCSETFACIGAVNAKMRPIARPAYDTGAVIDIPHDLLVELEQCFVDTSAASSVAVHDLFAPVVLGGGGCRGRKCAWAVDDTGNPLLDANGRQVPGPCWYGADQPECATCLQEQCPNEYAACTSAAQ